MTTREVDRWIALYMYVTIAQLVATRDALALGHTVWAAWFIATWLALTWLVTDLVFLVADE